MCVCVCVWPKSNQPHEGWWLCSSYTHPSAPFIVLQDECRNEMNITSTSFLHSQQELNCTIPGGGQMELHSSC